MRQLDSIRARVSVSFTLAFAIVVLIAAGVIHLSSERIAEHDAGTLLRITADTIHQQMGAGLSGSDLAELVQDRAELRAENIVLSVEDAHGHPMSVTDGTGPWPDLHGPQWRTVRVPVGTDTVVVGYPWQRMERGLHTRALELTALSLCVILMAAAGSWIMVGRTLSPIATLSRQADAASVDSLDVTLPTPSRDAEIVQLVDTLNGLLRRLSEAAEARGRFYAAASHELRTPLQALLGHIEVALSKERDRDGYRLALEEVRAQTVRLTTLVRDLLLLNQLQASTSRPPEDEVDLVSLCDSSLEALAPAIQEKCLLLREDMPDEVLITGPSTHADMVVRNVLENAVKYASEGGQVRVALREEAQGWRLECHNSFRLAEQLDLARIFEPFYRPDSSRQSATGGNGLGLAICRAIADVNGWDIRLAQDPSGVTATVRFA